MKHILSVADFDKEYLEKLFALADELREKPDERLKGKILATLFYEPSTRTRLSFESAMLRLGGQVISVENAKESSSATKGETLEDSIRVISAYADAIAIRHPEAGAAERAAKAARVSVINAGDGANEHPTQALLDLYTIKREFGEINGKTVALVGDLKYGRAARSLARLLALYKGVRMLLTSPAELPLDPAVEGELSAGGVVIEKVPLEEAARIADVIYMTRIQKERFAVSQEYEKLKGSYVLTRAVADSMKPSAIIMHPLPRVDEIAPEVDASPHARYFEEAENGVYIRMALLADLLS